MHCVCCVGSTGRFNCLKVRLKSVQLDNQLPDSLYPVTMAPWNLNPKIPLADRPPVLDVSIVREAGTRQGYHKYPSITSTLGNMQLFIDETVIWRVKSMLDLISSSAPTSTVSFPHNALYSQSDTAVNRVLSVCIASTIKLEHVPVMLFSIFLSLLSEANSIIIFPLFSRLKGVVAQMLDWRLGSSSWMVSKQRSVCAQIQQADPGSASHCLWD